VKQSNTNRLFFLYPFQFYAIGTPIAKISRAFYALFFFLSLHASLAHSSPEVQKSFEIPLQNQKKDQKGQLDVLLLAKDKSQINRTFFINEKSYTADSEGSLRISLPSSDSYSFRQKINDDWIKTTFRVIPGESTQLLVDTQTNRIQRFAPIEKNLTESKNSLTEDSVLFKGRILSTKNQPISDARIYVKNSEIKTRSGPSGIFEVRLPQGQQTLSISHPKYSTEIFNNVTITVEQESPRKFLLTPAGLVLESFVVLAPKTKGSVAAMIEVRRNSENVADVMSAEQMSRSGDSTAASSLRRVTGLTLVDGKFVYVRGLGERYSSTLFNGISLPSPDPTRRVIPLDIFPVQILESLVIQKSYSPDRPGEFGGGTVALNTKTLPDKKFFKVSVGEGYQLGMGPLRAYQGGEQDWLGIDDGKRSLPQSLQNARSGTGDSNVFRQRNNHQITDQKTVTLPNLSAAFGNSWGSRTFRFGMTASGLLSDQLYQRDEERNRLEIENGNLSVFRQKRNKVEETTNLGGILSTGIEYRKKHKVEATYSLLRRTTNYVAETRGQDEEEREIRMTDREWAERQLNSLILKGQHQVPGLSFLTMNWHWGQSDASRYEPDKVVDTFVRSGADQFVFGGFIDDPTAYQRRFFDLRDKATDIGAKLKAKIPWFYGRKGSLAVGWNQVEKSRSSWMRRFGLNFNQDIYSQQKSILPTNSLDTIIPQCQNGGEYCFNYEERTRPTDTYKATQQLNSYYLKTDLPLLRNLKLSTGMRFESSDQDVNSIDTFTDANVKSRLTTRNGLPGSTLTYKLNRNMQLRGAYSETLSRPDFKELSNTLWRDFEGGFDVRGNPNLRSTVIDSYDLRWEWYFGPKENLSFGVFHKNFSNPVESVFESGSDQGLTFVNADSAKNTGIEVEFSKALSFISGPWGHFTLAGNFSYIRSRVSLANAATLDLASSERPLQGQSPYTVNLLLDYQNESSGWQGSLAYNVYGERISFLDPNALPDILEKPFHQLDLIFSKKFGKKYQVGGKIQNLLNNNLRMVQGDQIWRRYRKGLGISASLRMEL